MRDDFSRTLLGMPAGLPSSRIGIAETFPRWAVVSDLSPSTNTWIAAACYLPAGLRVTGITLFSGLTALSVGTHQWFGIWDNTLTLWGGSADDTSTAWAAQTAKRLTLTTAKTTTYAGRYYVGAGFTATTAPSLIGVYTPSSAVRTLTPYLQVYDSTTVLTALAATLVQNAGTNAMVAPYAVLD